MLRTSLQRADDIFAEIEIVLPSFLFCLCAKPVSVLRKNIYQTINALNKAYNNYFGSLFHSGTKRSYFSMQVQRYADLYSYDYLNLLNYPLFYHFTATYTTLPHEYLAD